MIRRERTARSYARYALPRCKPSPTGILKNQVDGTAMIFDESQSRTFRPSPYKGSSLMPKSVRYHQRDELFRKLIGTVVVQHRVVTTGMPNVSPYAFTTRSADALLAE